MREAVEIVLIEDNPEDVELTLRALKENNLANNVKVLRDGQEALDYIFENIDCTAWSACPKVILLDLKLPKIDGLEVLQKIRSDGRTSCMPVVMLTSSNEDRDRIESYKLGVNSYIVKPVGFDTFIRAIAQVGCYWVALNKPPY